MSTETSGIRSVLKQLAAAETRDSALNSLRGDHPHGMDRDEPDLHAWPASPVQHQLWALTRLSDVGAAYNVPFVLEVSGQVDSSAITDAVQTALARHDGLNTSFAANPADGALRQQRRDTPLFPEGLAVESADAEQAARIVHAEARRHFNLEDGPLISARVLRLTPDRHWILLVGHHMVVDGWSMGILTQDVSSLLAGRDCQAAGSWARYQNNSQPNVTHVDHWTDELADVIGLETGLVPDYDTRHPTLAAGTIRFLIPHDETSPQAAANAVGVSLFALHFAAFQRAVASLTDTVTVVTGVPLLNRSPASGSVVGPLSNTLPLKLDTSGGDVELLQRADAVVKEALVAQDAPISEVVKALPGLDHSQANPLFKQLLNMGNLPGVAQDQGDDRVHVHVRGVPNNTSRVGMEMTLEDPEGDVSGRVEFDKSLFRPTTAHQLVEEYQRELRRLCSVSAGGN